MKFHPNIHKRNPNFLSFYKCPPPFLVFQTPHPPCLHVRIRKLTHDETNDTVVPLTPLEPLPQNCPRPQTDASARRPVGVRCGRRSRRPRGVPTGACSRGRAVFCSSCRSPTSIQSFWKVSFPPIPVLIIFAQPCCGRCVGKRDFVGIMSESVRFF